MEKEVKITVCKPSRRNKPKQLIKCSGGSPNHVWLGSLTQRMDRIERELNEAIDSQLIHCGDE